jgi:hypothetical protein
MAGIAIPVLSVLAACGMVWYLLRNPINWRRPK